MKGFLKRLISAAVSASVLTVGMVFPVSAADPDYTQIPCTMEAEDQDLGSETVWKDIYGQEFPGYSGSGFVYVSSSGFTFEVNMKDAGMYDIVFSYIQILDQGPRHQTIYVNGVKYEKDFPRAEAWRDISFEKVRFKQGINEIKFANEYGYAGIDTITIKEPVYDDLTGIDPTPCDPEATPEVRSLLAYLASDVYGQHVLSGQQEIYGGGNDGDYELEFEFIHDLSGEYPAIRGFDFMNYNPLYGWDDNTTERVIAWTKERNGIATASWHINVPLDFANYTLGDEVDWQKCTYSEKGDFDTAKAIVDGTKENEYVKAAIADLAEQLLRVQEAGVPIILRPFHEAEGNGGLDGSGAWFWWSKAGADVYKQLWKMLYTSLTEEYGIHNIIWEENLYNWSEESAQWYVGDDYVDIVGYDKYNTEYHRHDGKTSGPNEDAESSIFYDLVHYTNNSKMVAMAENDTIPNVENMELEKAYWLYFCPWYGEHILDKSKNDPQTVKALYQSDLVLTLDELPEDWLTVYASGDVTPKIKAGDVNGDKKVNIYDFILAKRMLIEPTDRPAVLAASPEDVNGDGTFDVEDITLFVKYLLGENVKLKTYSE